MKNDNINNFNVTNINEQIKRNMKNLYQKRAKNYNFISNLYDLIFIGYSESTYRKKTVKALKLQRGDTVVDLCCGTGRNFSLLQQYIGTEGKIIRVDLTDAMLEQAQIRVEKNGWSNVELVQSDAAKYNFPPDIDGVISTLAITLVPEYDITLQNASKSLRSGKRCAIFDIKRPTNWLKYFWLLARPFLNPFGQTKEVEKRHPWESIDKYFNNTSMTEYYFGIVYLSVGEVP